MFVPNMAHVFLLRAAIVRMGMGVRIVSIQFALVNWPIRAQFAIKTDRVLHQTPATAPLDMFTHSVRHQFVMELQEMTA